MSTAVLKTNAARSTTVSRLERAVRRMIEDHAAWRQRRATRRELARLGATSGHLLRDIGMFATEADLAPVRSPSIW